MYMCTCLSIVIKLVCIIYVIIICIGKSLYTHVICMICMVIHVHVYQYSLGLASCHVCIVCIYTAVST